MPLQLLQNLGHKNKSAADSNRPYFFYFFFFFSERDLIFFMYASSKA